MNKKVLLSCFALLSSLTVSSFAQITTNFETTATINASCSMSVANASFGNINPNTTTDAQTSSALDIICSKGITANIAIDAGSSGVYTARHMVGSNGNTDTFNYNISTHVMWDVLWGSGNGGNGSRKQIVGTGNLENYFIYFKAPARQYVSPDTYTDTLAVIIYY